MLYNGFRKLILQFSRFSPCVFAIHILILLLFSQSASTLESSERPAKTALQCEQRYQAILKNPQFSTPRSKREAWQKQKQACALQGIYEKNLADLYFMQGEYRTAEALLQTALTALKTTDENPKYLRHLLATVEYKLWQLADLKRIADTLIEENPEWFSGYYHLGLYHFARKEWALAEPYFSKALQLKGGVETELALTSVYYELDNVSQGILFFERSLESNPNLTLENTTVSTQAVKMLIKEGKLEKAKKILEQLEAHDENIVDHQDYQFAHFAYQQALGSSATSVEP